MSNTMCAGFRFFFITMLGVSLNLSSGAVQAADGDLDPSFDTDGKVITDFGTGDDQGHDVAIQNDGKIIVVGHTQGALNDYALARYNSDGSLDSTFSGDGIVQTDFDARADVASAVAIQSDGKIVVAGSSYSGNKMSLARYNPDGSLDPTFSGDGRVLSNFGTGADLAIQNDGKIVVGGISDNITLHDFAVVRFNPDGSVDDTFSDDGKVQTDFFGFQDSIYSVAIQQDGSIVVAGDAFDGSLHHFALARYNPNGTLDNSFSSDGKVTTHFPGSFHNIGGGHAIQRDGKIVVGGMIQFNFRVDLSSLQL